MARSVEFRGVFPIIVTPFDEREEIDPDSLRRTIEFMARAGAGGVTILGVLGEADRLTDAERDVIVQEAVSAAKGRIAVVVGASHCGTRAAAELSRRAEELGADAVMLAPPREAAANPAAIIEYYERAASATGIPIVVQDHPASTQVPMPADLLLRLVSEIPRVACIKEEAPPTAWKVSLLRKGMTDRRVAILTGLGALYGGFELQSGADGFMTGFAFPEILVAMVRAMKEGKSERVFEIYRHYRPLIVFEQQPGVAIRKELFRLRGLIGTNTVRRPGASIDPETAAMIGPLLDKVMPGADIQQPLEI